MTKDTGGSAFPVLEQRNSIGDISVYSETGMTLRDWFAGQALSGMLSIFADPEMVRFDPEHAAGLAYSYADSMLKTRNKK